MALLHIDDTCCKQGRGKNKEKPFDFLPVKDIEEVVHALISPSRYQNELRLYKYMPVPFGIMTLSCPKSFKR